MESSLVPEKDKPHWFDLMDHRLASVICFLSVKHAVLECFNQYMY